MAMDYEKIYRIAFELPSPPKELKYDWAAYIIFPYVRFLNKEGYGFSVFCKDNDDKTTDFIYLNANWGVVLKQHLLTRYRKRIQKELNSLDIRSNSKDRILLLINAVFNLCVKCALFEFDTDNYYIYTRLGFIPSSRLSEHIFEGKTFLSVDLLKPNQLKVWEEIELKIGNVNNKPLDTLKIEATYDYELGKFVYH